jgi:hypothetical protein
VKVIVCVEINAVGDEATRIESALRDALKPYSWVRPLKSVYVVPLESEQQVSSIQSELLKRFMDIRAGAVYYLVVPVSGRFDGFLPSNMWPPLND